MKNLGIEEKIPKSTPQLNYEKLKGPGIRIFNRIIKYMNENDLETVDELWRSEDILETYEVISKTKTHNIEVIHVDHFRDLLRKISIVPFGEELDDDFKEFLELNEEYDHLIMVKKLKKSLKAISKNEYFQSFGTKKKWEEDVWGPTRKTSKILRSLSKWEPPELKLEKSMSLKSTIEEKNNDNKCEKVEDQDLLDIHNYGSTKNGWKSMNGFMDTMDSKEQIRKSLFWQESCPCLYWKSKSKKKDTPKELDDEEMSSFKSVDLSDIEDEEEDRKIMMRKKFGLMPSFKRWGWAHN